MELGQTRNVREYYQVFDETSESYTQGSPSGLQHHNKTFSPPLLDSKEITNTHDAADDTRAEHRLSVTRITSRKRARPHPSASQDRQEACQDKGRYATTKTSNPPEAPHTAAADNSDPHRPAKRPRSGGERNGGETQIPANAPGRSFIAVVSIQSALEARALDARPSYFPGNLLTNDSINCLELGQLRHIEATYAYARFLFDMGDLESKQLRPVLGYIRQLLLHARALARWSPGWLSEARDAADVLPNFPGRPLTDESNVPLDTDVILDTEQLHHMREAYCRFIRLKSKLQGPEKREYDYLLGCMEQLLHHVRGLEAEVNGFK